MISLEVLEEALKSTDKTMLIVSHDRTFIDKVCDHIIEIKNTDIEEFNGNYSKYIEDKTNRKNKTTSQKNNEEILLLENKMTHIISMLCIETNLNKKAEYEKEYNVILAKLKELRNN
ncbi:MAG: hypothetical protein ACRCXT_16205 [Paraclostridium sp.]